MKQKKDYGFDLEKEYDIYKKVGNSKEEFGNYTQWEKHILEKIEKFSREVKINFKHYLIKYKRKYARRKSITTSILVPIYVFFLTSIITFITIIFNVYENFNDSMLGIITNSVDIANNYREIIKNMSNNSNHTISFIMVVLFGNALLLLVLYLMFKFSYSYCSQKEDFYNDLIEILEHSIEQDVKK